MNCLNSSNLLSSERLYFNLNIYLFNCFFFRSTIFNGDGSIIYINTVNINMTIIECFFYLCSSTNDGGCILFECLSLFTCINIKKTCANNCKSNNFPFLQITLGNNINNINNFNLISYYKCSDDGLSSHPTRFVYGNLNFDNINSSLNYCHAVSGMSLVYLNYFKGIFFTFQNNKHSNNGYVCFNINSGNENKFFNYSNIINNTSPNLNYGVIYLHNGAKFFINNFIFYNNFNYLFYIQSGNLIIENCYINHQLNSLNIGNINTINILNYISKINLIHYCLNYQESLKNSKKKINLFVLYFNLINRS